MEISIKLSIDHTIYWSLMDQTLCLEVRGIVGAQSDVCGDGADVGGGALVLVVGVVGGLALPAPAPAPALVIPGVRVLIAIKLPPVRWQAGLQIESVIRMMTEDNMHYLGSSREQFVG